MKKYLLHLLLLAFLCVPAPALAKGVVLNFTDVDIATMAKFISDLTGKNIVMDDRVKGKISVFSPSKLTTDEAFSVFTSVLELKGFTIIPAGKVYKIVPTSVAKQSGMRILTGADKGPVNEAYVGRVIPLENIPAQEAVNFLQPMVSKDGYISSFGPANMLLVVDSALNIQKILGIVALIDTDQRREGGEIYFLKNASADAAASLIREWLGTRGRGAAAAAATGRQAQAAAGQAAATATVGGLIVPDQRLNALVIFGSDKDKADIKKILEMIDVPPPTTSSKVNVYYLENADAIEVAKVLDGIVKTAATAPASAPVAPGQAAAAPQQALFEGSRISINADKATNSLVIMASPADYQNLVQVIQKLDRRRRQVFVEAVVAEVSLGKLRDLGIQPGAFAGVANSAVATAGFYDPYNTFSQVLTALGRLDNTLDNEKIELKSAANFPVLLKALDTKGLVNVLSTPTILTSDNKEAEIFVGENVPFLGKLEVSNTTTTPSFQSVERKDTGITLKLTPQISEGEYIKLDIYQEISAVKDSTTAGAADLVTTKRSAKTSVVVKDAETVVIGGLIQDRDENTTSKIPLLGDIPILGWLFTYKSVRHEKTNLMILLTPRIVKDARDLAAISEAERNRFKTVSGPDALNQGVVVEPKR